MTDRLGVKLDRRLRRANRLVLFGSALIPALSAGQGSGEAAPAGGELERYLRAQQVAGRIPLEVWSIRGFGDKELARIDTALGARWIARSAPRTNDSLRWVPLGLESGIVFNSAFPFGMNDGPLWAGKGFTAYATGGIAARRGRFAAGLRPYLYVAQNAEFSLAETGLPGRQIFSNWVHPTVIDFPQRYGNGRIVDFDPGESYVRADFRAITAGFSTAAQIWGPAVENPVVLGNNAGGFPHAFLGSSRPLFVGPLRIHGRLIWGALRGSDYGPQSPGYRDFATGIVASFGIRGAPGFEFGGTRFFHAGWPDGGLMGAPFLAVFQGLLKESLVTPGNPGGTNPLDNQLASVFFRWVSPASKVEIYGEFGREDHSWDLRDLAQEPDHDSAYLLGLQRVWPSESAALTAVRAELVNARISHLNAASPQVSWYVHTPLTMGHTHNGQLLGSPGAFGGGGSTVAIDRYDDRGRLTVRWDRIMRAEQLRGGMPSPDQADVMHALRFERLRFVEGGAILVSVGGVANFNRNFARDAYGLTAHLSHTRR